MLDSNQIIGITQFQRNIKKNIDSVVQRIYECVESLYLDEVEDPPLIKGE